MYETLKYFWAPLSHWDWVRSHRPEHDGPLPPRHWGLRNEFELLISLSGAASRLRCRWEVLCWLKYNSLFQRWKKFEDRLRFHEGTTMSWRFEFWETVYSWPARRRYYINNNGRPSCGRALPVSAQCIDLLRGGFFHWPWMWWYTADGCRQPCDCDVITRAGLELPCCEERPTSPGYWVLKIVLLSMATRCWKVRISSVSRISLKRGSKST